MDAPEFKPFLRKNGIPASGDRNWGGVGEQAKKSGRMLNGRDGYAGLLRNGICRNNLVTTLQRMYEGILSSSLSHTESRRT